jgi:hypothetical protein
MAVWKAQVYYKSCHIGEVLLEDQGVYASGMIHLSDRGGVSLNLYGLAQTMTVMWIGPRLRTKI